MGSPDDHTPPESGLDHVADGVMNVVVPGYDRQVRRILQDMSEEAAADRMMLETEQRLMDERPDPAAPGLDLTAVAAADPAFDGQQFLVIARECFYRLREARNLDDPRVAEGELSPWLMDQLRSVIRGDVASHRHLLLAGLDVTAAVIDSAAVDDDQGVTLTVRFHLRAEEVVRADDGAIVGGDLTEREWDERWTFFHDPRVDGSAADAVRCYEPLERGGWLIAHQGWLVIKIERIGAPDPLNPTNL